jgi:hypothetical protein
MTAKTPARPGRPVSVVDAADGMDVPPPAAARARDGMEESREMARRYMPNAVSFLASVALRRTARPHRPPKCLPAKSWCRLPAFRSRPRRFRLRHCLRLLMTSGMLKRAPQSLATQHGARAGRRSGTSIC